MLVGSRSPYLHTYMNYSGQVITKLYTKLLLQTYRYDPRVTIPSQLKKIYLQTSYKLWKRVKSRVIDIEILTLNSSYR